MPTINDIIVEHFFSLRDPLQAGKRACIGVQIWSLGENKTSRGRAIEPSANAIRVAIAVAASAAPRTGSDTDSETAQ